MTNYADFDALARKATETNAMEDLNALFAAVFALPEWQFIARGDLGNITPYIAANPAYAGGQQMIRAFTDGERLMRFARENNLTESNGSCATLGILTSGAVDYLEQFVAKGVHGVWFNSDTGSDGFFVPLKQLRPIREHLEKSSSGADTRSSGAAAYGGASKPITVLVTVKDALMLPSGFVSPASYNCNFFCRVPEDWVENGLLKPENLEKIYRQVYGEYWRAGNSDGSRYVVLNCVIKILDEQTAAATVWTDAQNTEHDHIWFYVTDPNGIAVRGVSAAEFQQIVRNG